MLVQDDKVLIYCFFYLKNHKNMYSIYWCDYDAQKNSLSYSPAIQKKDRLFLVSYVEH